jgi:hypothetical protein
VVDGLLGDVDGFDTVKDTNSLARSSGVVEGSKAILHAVNSLLLVDGATVLADVVHDRTPNIAYNLGVEVSFRHDGSGFLHGFLHLGLRDLSIFGLNAIDVVEDGSGLVLVGDAHARDGGEHLEVLNGESSDILRLGIVSASFGVGIELSDSVLESHDTFEHGDGSVVLLEEISDFLLDVSSESGVDVGLIESLGSTFQLSTINFHVVVGVKVAEDDPGLLSRGNSSARDGGVLGGGEGDSGGGSS